MTATIGVDLGGTKVCALLSDQSGAVRHRVWQRHQASDYTSTLATVDIAVTECLGAAREHSLRVAGIGMAIAAWLDTSRGQVLQAANLGFTGQPLQADLRARFGLPVCVVNDADAAAVAEARFGAGRNAPVLVLLTLGTGVGGGIVLDGRLFTGASGLAAELGHVSVGANTTFCVCGGTGCLELVASGPAVARRGHELLLAGKAPLLRDIARAAPDAVTSDHVVSAALAGDAAAREVLVVVGQHVGTALATVTAVLDPSLVLLGGGLASAAGRLIVGAARAALTERLSLAHLRDPVPVQLAACGDDAGARGAAALAHDEARGNR